MKYVAIILTILDPSGHLSKIFKITLARNDTISPHIYVRTHSASTEGQFRRNFLWF